jgi:transcriptional regulator with XRE-family HTH domain
MKMASRIKQVRELTGKRQAEVAALLNITQQAYCGLEQSADNAKLETLRRFCRVMEIDIAYLVSDAIPITHLTLTKYGRKGCAEIISGYEQMEKETQLFAGLQNESNKN